MWDCVSSDGNFSKNRSEEMMSREESPEWNLENRQRRNALNPSDDERLPSWDFLESALNRKLSRYEHQQAHSSDSMGNGPSDVEIDYFVMANAKTEFSRENSRSGKGARITTAESTKSQEDHFFLSRMKNI